MFPATISILVASGDTVVLNRVNQDNFGSEYRFADATRSASLKIRHSSDSPKGDGLVMLRHNVFFEYVVNPTPTTLQREYTFTGTLRHGRFDDPGMSASIAKGVTAWMNATTNMSDLAVGVN